MASASRTRTYQKADESRHGKPVNSGYFAAHGTDAGPAEGITNAR